MKLTHIRDILAVAEMGSLRAASKKLSITQPSITRSIRDVEKELGQLLFTRHSHGATLTQMGETFVQRAVAIQSELRHITEDFQQAKGQFTGQVSVSISAAASMALLPQVLRTFYLEHPDAMIHITENMFQSVEADILSGKVDFFVGPYYASLSTTSLFVEHLFDNSRVIVARKGHPLAKATTLAELAGARWIRPTFSSRRDEADFDSMFTAANLAPPRIVTQTSGIMTTLLTTANSDLLTITPIQWLSDPVVSALVARISIGGPLPAAPVCIIRRGDLPLTPLAQRMCDIVRKVGHNYGRRRIKQ